MSRNHKKRDKFRVDSLLDIVTHKHAVEEEKSGAPNNFMTLMFLGFYNKLMMDEQFVEVEIVVSKISQMKRKDSFKSKQDRVRTTAPMQWHIGRIPLLMSGVRSVFDCSKRVFAIYSSVRPSLKSIRWI